MENVDMLEPAKYLVAIWFDGANNMMGVKSGAAVRLQQVYIMALEN